MSDPAPRYLFFGKLQREYIITANNTIYLDQPGGNVLYAAGGAALWQEEDETAGIVARVGEDFPRQWIKDLKGYGYNTKGINILQESVDLRAFRRYADMDNYIIKDPIGHFANLEKPFPQALLGYKPKESKPDSLEDLTTLSIRPSDIPQEYLYANAAHLGPIDYLTHSLIPNVLRQEGITTITLKPDRGYIQPDFWDDLQPIFNDIDGLMFSEQDLRNLFKDKTNDLWEMTEEIATKGCPLVIVLRGERGQILYDANSKKKYEVPAYDARVVDTTGAGSAFCGGFLVGFRHTFDPLESVLHGNIAASIMIEGSGVFYSKDVLPGLQAARLENLQAAVRKV